MLGLMLTNVTKIILMLHYWEIAVLIKDISISLKHISYIIKNFPNTSTFPNITFFKVDWIDSRLILSLKNNFLSKNLDDFTLVNFENILAKFDGFQKSSTNKTDSTSSSQEPTFYSFTSNKMNDILKNSHGTTPISSLLNIDKIYMSVLELTSLFVQIKSVETSVQYVSIGYNFLFAWSLLDPVNGPLKIPKEFLTNSLELMVKDTSRSSFLKVAQLFRVAFKLVDSTGLDEASITALREISGGSTLDAPRIALEFFYKFWSSRLVPETVELNVLADEIELLNFHLKLLHEKFFDANLVINLSLNNTAETSQLRNSCISLIASFIKAFKTGYKRFIIMEK